MPCRNTAKCESISLVNDPSLGRHKGKLRIVKHGVASLPQNFISTPS